MPRHTGAPEQDAQRIVEAQGPLMIPLPLVNFRAVVSDDIPSWSSDPSGGGAGSAGVLASDTTPALHYVNGDTDSTHRVQWATSGQMPITAAVPIPKLDTEEPIEIYVDGEMGGTTDSPSLLADLYLDGPGVSVSKLEESIDTWDSTREIMSDTIVDGDVPELADGGGKLTLEFEPSSGHTTNVMNLYAVWLEVWPEPNYRV